MGRKYVSVQKFANRENQSSSENREVGLFGGMMDVEEWARVLAVESQARVERGDDVGGGIRLSPAGVGLISSSLLLDPNLLLSPNSLSLSSFPFTPFSGYRIFVLAYEDLPMKFSKSLYFAKTPEWASKYVRYKVLKSHISATKKALLHETSTALSTNFTKDAQQVPETPLVALASLGPEVVFWRELMIDLETVSGFFNDKVSEGERQFEALLTYARDLGFDPQSIDLAPRPVVGEQLPEGVIVDVSVKEEVYDPSMTASTWSSLHQSSGHPRSQGPSKGSKRGKKDRSGGSSRSRSQRRGGSSRRRPHPRARSPAAQASGPQLISRSPAPHVAQESRHNKKTPAETAPASPIPGQALPRKKMNKTKKGGDASDAQTHIDIRRMREFLLEYYRGLDLIEQFADVNVEAFRKILKKHDKVLGTTTQDRWIESRVDPLPFANGGGTLEELVYKCEQLYANLFTEGSVSRARDELRVAPNSVGATAVSFDWTTFIIGLGSGSATVLIATAIWLLTFAVPDPWTTLPSFEAVLTTYRAVLMPIALMWLWAFDSWCWVIYRVNFSFIFGFDQRSTTSYQRLFSFASLFSMLWGLFFLAYVIVAGGFATTSLHPFVFPMLLIASSLLVTLYYQYRSNWWLLKVLLDIIICPFSEVGFRHAFITDQLGSIVVGLLDFQHAICFLAIDGASDADDICLTVINPVLQPYLVLLPSWWSLVQQFARYYQSPSKTTALNAVKYLSGIAVGVLSHFRVVSPDHPSLFWLWLGAATFTTLFTFGWDVVRDWGLFAGRARSPNAPHLRKTLLYPHWLYLLSIPANLVFRFLWVLTISPKLVGVKSDQARWLFRLSLALGEVVRRSIWNLFRLEQEMLHNLDKFRAVDAVPIPHGRDALESLE